MLRREQIRRPPREEGHSEAMTLGGSRLALKIANTRGRVVQTTKDHRRALPEALFSCQWTVTHFRVTPFK